MRANATQFVHLDAYSSARPLARTRGGRPATGGGRRWSAAEILEEASRAPHASRHVDAPQPPTWRLGDAAAVAAAGDAWRNGTRQPNGKRVRGDSPWLAAGVVSMPARARADWPKVRDTAVAALRDRFGDRLRAVVEHTDEAHPHLHFFLVPRPGEDFGVVHPGYAAKTAARRSGDRLVLSAFTDAMRAFQDWFHGCVGGPCGLARIGPRRARLPRAEYLADRAERRASQAERQAREHVEAARQQADLIDRAARAQADTYAERVREAAITWWKKARAGLAADPTAQACAKMQRRLAAAEKALAAGNWAEARQAADEVRALDPLPKLLDQPPPEVANALRTRRPKPP